MWRKALRAARELKQEKQLQRRLLNIGHLLTGNFFGAMLALVAFALTARALGPTDYGKLALVFTFARTLEYLVSFQSWQPLIAYGAKLTGSEHREDLKVLLKFGLCLDLGSALVSWLLALILVFAAMPIFGWDKQTLAITVVYSTVLLVRVSGMPTAVLRMANRFSAMAYSSVFVAAVRLALCLIAVLVGGKLWFFVFIWMTTQALAPLVQLALAVHELRKQGVRGILRAPLRGVTRRFPGILGFSWSTNLSLTFQTSAQQFDTLLVGALADPAAAGLYHIAKRIGRMAQQVAVQAQAVLYPDVAKLWAQFDIAGLRRAVLQIAVLLAVLGAALSVFFLVTAKPLLRWTAGPEFLAAAPLLVVQMMAVALSLTNLPIRAALIAMGRQREVLRIVFVGTAAFHSTVLLLVPQIGPMGANIAHVILGSIALVGFGLVFRHALKRALALGPLPPSAHSNGSPPPDMGVG